MSLPTVFHSLLRGALCVGVIIVVVLAPFGSSQFIRPQRLLRRFERIADIVSRGNSDNFTFGSPQTEDNIPETNTNKVFKHTPVSKLRFRNLFRRVPDSRIIRGSASVIEDHPYQVGIEFMTSFSCGGSLITDSFVLTAAHCIQWSEALHLYLVRAASTMRQTGGVSRRIADPVYDHPMKRHGVDVSILRLREPFELSSYVYPVRLPPPGGDMPPGQFVIISGWGRLDEHNVTLPKKLQDAQVPVVERGVCNKMVSQQGLSIKKHEFCAGGYDANGVDSCQGDSGGPAVDMNGVQVGVVSWGVGCGNPKFPGVYTMVQHPMVRSFIAEVARI